jgi:hypothetical protein
VSDGTGDGSGFSWGLRPRGASEPEPDTVPPVELPPVDVPPVDVPTEAIQQVDLPTQAIEQAELPTQAIEQADLPTQGMTQPMSWGELTEAAPAPAEPTQAFGVPGWQDEPSAPSDPTSAIDSLFSDTKFQEYQEIGLLQTIAEVAGPADAAAASEPRAARAPLMRNQKILLWSGAGVVAALVLVLCFLLGTRLGTTTTTAAPKPVKSGQASSAPTQAPTSDALAPGLHAWNTLKGGECIQPFTSPWSVSFTTVDCGGAHAAQLLLKGVLPDASGTAYPTAAAIQAEITPLCTAPTALNYSAAASVTDAQISVSYPPTKSAWDGGDRTFYCFVTRSSGNDLTGSVAVAAG